MFRFPLQSKPFRGFVAIALTVFPAAYAVAKAADGMSVENGGATRAPEGKQIFETRCAACHGVDGRGDPGRQLLKIDLPDFTDCSFISRETDADFAAVIHEGGPARGFSVLMPAHGKAPSEAERDEVDARSSDSGAPSGDRANARASGSGELPVVSGRLEPAEIALVIAYLRTFCTDARWPRGELNLPRPLLTEKAFPEDEAVVTTLANVDREGLISTELLFETRIGARGMVEIALPVTSREWVKEDRDREKWYSGVGDLAVGAKYAFFHSLEIGSIASLGGEIKVPTGNDDRGLGKGSVVFEPYLAAAQLLPADSFAQLQLLGEIPTRGASEIQLRGALGKTFTPNLHGRGWSPMVEVIGVFGLGNGGESNLDIVPQIQIPLNRRQHVRINVGVSIPATRNDERATRVGAYLLWDWFDGGFFEGW